MTERERDATDVIRRRVGDCGFSPDTLLLLLARFIDDCLGLVEKLDRYLDAVAKGETDAGSD